MNTLNPTQVRLGIGPRTPTRVFKNRHRVLIWVLVPGTATRPATARAAPRIDD